MVLRMGNGLELTLVREIFYWRVQELDRSPESSD